MTASRLADPRSAMWPRTLFGRNLLLMACLLGACLMLAGLVFRGLVQGPNVREYAVFTAVQVKVASQALALLPPEQRAARLAAFGDSGLLGLATTAPPPNEVEVPRRLLMREFIETLRARLADPGEPPAAGDVRWYPRRSQLWIALPDLQPPIWAVVSLQGLSLGVSGAGVLAFGVCLLFALTGAYLIGRRINRPLQALARAAQAVGEGRAPSPWPEAEAEFDQAPSEIREVALQFNGMAHAIARADEERALMLAGISHDLRTPLAKLRLGTEMLARDDEAELVERMRRSCEEMDAILGQFIDFARFSSEGMTAVPVDLAALVRDTAKSFEEARPPLRLQLDADGQAMVSGRLHALRRALANLIGNALRHGHAGRMDDKADAEPVTITLARAGTELRLSVLDRGPGIALAEVERLKRPFTQLDASRSRGGTGLGLAIADGVARAHGGRLALLARPGGGLEARLELPALTATLPSGNV